MGFRVRGRRWRFLVVWVKGPGCCVRGHVMGASRSGRVCVFPITVGWGVGITGEGLANWTALRGHLDTLILSHSICVS